MVKTVQIGTCVSVQGILVRMLGDGRAIVRVGKTDYVGRPVN